jgi:hypothetical protein
VVRFPIQTEVFFSSPPRPDRLLSDRYRAGVKRPDREANDSPPFSEDVKNA